MPRARRIPSFLMGADPELAVYKNGRFFSADHIDGIEMDGHFGLDGCRRIAELRPDPAEEPEQLVENIKICLAEGLEKYPALRACELKAGSCWSGNPIGGHIHFGIRGARRTGSIYAKCLDALVAQVTIPLEERGAAIARREDYGSLGDWRIQAHGFEYRPLSSWLTSPRVALGVLSLAKLVATAVKMDTNSNFHVKCSRLLPDDTSVSEAGIRRMRGRLDAIKTVIADCALFPRYDKSISFLYALAEDNRTWETDRTLVEEWGLADLAARRRGRPAARVVEPTMLAAQTIEALLTGRVAGL